MSSRILGLDLGTKRLGVAISDVNQNLASALTVIEYDTNHFSHAINGLKPIFDKYNIEKVVLGYPKNMNNTASKMSNICENFKKRLEKEFCVEVILFDERMTSMIANKVLTDNSINKSKKKQIVDKIAATVILQNYLDTK